MVVVLTIWFQGDNKGGISEQNSGSQMFDVSGYLFTAATVEQKLLMVDSYTMAVIGYGGASCIRAVTVVLFVQQNVFIGKK